MLARCSKKDTTYLPYASFLALFELCIQWLYNIHWAGARLFVILSKQYQVRLFVRHMYAYMHTYLFVKLMLSVHGRQDSVLVTLYERLSVSFPRQLKLFFNSQFTTSRILKDQITIPLCLWCVCVCVWMRKAQRTADIRPRQHSQIAHQFWHYQSDAVACREHANMVCQVHVITLHLARILHFLSPISVENRAVVALISEILETGQRSWEIYDFLS